MSIVLLVLGFLEFSDWPFFPYRTLFMHIIKHISMHLILLNLHVFVRMHAKIQGT